MEVNWFHLPVDDIIKLGSERCFSAPVLLRPNYSVSKAITVKYWRTQLLDWLPKELTMHCAVQFNECI